MKFHKKMFGKTQIIYIHGQNDEYVIFGVLVGITFRLHVVPINHIVTDCLEGKPENWFSLHCEKCINLLHTGKHQ